MNLSKQVGGAGGDVLKTRMAAPLRQLKLRGSPLSECQELVLLLHDDQQLTYEEIGLRLGVSQTRIRQICATAKEIRDDYARNGRDALSLLPTRVQNVLGCLNFTSRPQVKAAIAAREFLWNDKFKAIFYKGRSPRNIGRESWLALEDWVADDCGENTPANSETPYRRDLCRPPTVIQPSRRGTAEISS